MTGSSGSTRRSHATWPFQEVTPGALAHPFIAGTVAVRSPVAGAPGDDGWHIDASFERDGAYWLNADSRDRSLLMLVLFTDVGDWLSEVTSPG